jgi:hypothetical protein
VYYECRSHAGAQGDHVITLHNGRWAFCRGGGSAPHEWSETGGIAVPALATFAKRTPPASGPLSDAPGRDE